MIAAVVAVFLAHAAPPEPPPADVLPPDAPAVVAGASVAGFVGGTLFAVPAVLALLPGPGPFVAWPVGLALAGGGAAFGGFLGELSYARIGGSGVVAGTAAAAALVGATAGGFGGAGLGATTSSTDAVFFGLVGAAVGGIAGAAAGGAAGALWVPPEER